jgi:hypothetical protein
MSSADGSAGVSTDGLTIGAFTIGAAASGRDRTASLERSCAPGAGSNADGTAAATDAYIAAFRIAAPVAAAAAEC